MYTHPFKISAPLHYQTRRDYCIKNSTPHPPVFHHTLTIPLSRLLPLFLPPLPLSLSLFPPLSLALCPSLPLSLSFSIFSSPQSLFMNLRFLASGHHHNINTCGLKKPSNPSGGTGAWLMLATEDRKSLKGLKACIHEATFGQFVSTGLPIKCGSSIV